MTTDKKQQSGQCGCEAESQKIYRRVTQGQENAKPFSASAGWLAQFKRWYHVKNVQLAGKAGSADQKAAEEL